MKKILTIIVILFILIYCASVVYAELTATEGLAIDLSSAGAGTDFTIAFDPTELFGNRTWGDASTDTIVWTWNRATGTDPTLTFGSAAITVGGQLITTAGVDLGTSQALVGTTALTIGNNAQTVAINSSDWDIGATGIATGMGNITSDGTIEGATITEGGNAVYNATEHNWSIGDNASGDITFTFNGDAGDDGTFVWDVTEDDFTFNEKVEINTAPANAADPVLHLQDLTDTADNLVMDIQGNNRADPFGQDNDEAYVVYKLDDDLGNAVELARVTWKITDASNASIDSEYEIGVVTAGTLRDRFSLRGGGIVINEDSIDSNVRIESNNNQYLAIFDGGVDTVTIGSVTSLGLLGVDGQSDEVQLLVQGNGTQTAEIFVVENSAGTDILAVDEEAVTVVTDGTGTAEVVLPAGSVDGTEILDDTVDSDDYAADSIDNEHINWADIDNLGDEGAVTLSATVTVADDEATDDDQEIVFTTDNATLESDGDFHYSPDTGTVTATEFVGGGSGLTLASTDLSDTADIIYEAEIDTFAEIDAQVADKALINLADGGTFTGGIIANANLSVGNTTTTAGVLTLLEDDDDGANFASFMVPALAANTVYTLPPDDGDNTEVLQTDGDGVLTWVANAGAGDMLKATYDSGDSGGVDVLTTVDSTYASDYVLLTATAVGTDAPKTDGALTYDATSGTIAATEFSGGGSGLTAVDAATGDSATAFFDAGTIEHEYGGLQADISGYTGIIGITGADTTVEIDLLSELLTAMGDVTAFITDDDMPAAGTDPDVDAAGELGRDTDGGNEANDVSLRTFEGTSQTVLARTLKTLNFTLISPDTIDAADLIPVWHNTSGFTFQIKEWKAWSDDDDVSLEIEELTDQTDYTAVTTVDAVEIATDGTGVYYASDTTITHDKIEHDHSIAIDFDTSDTPDYVQISITGWFNADVN